ncbi:MAG: hypothetical protein A2041_02565 [Bacteroidetes bacterium GWA2_31_9b]|nr:MAG: hypothetical protein A2041_02565 [Bacteroidetes bacterium GWA2_31_9b]
MDKNTFQSISIMFIILILLPSCKSWIDPEINEDPNKPINVSMELLIPAIQVNMAYQIGGNNAVRPIGIWMQYFNSHSQFQFAVYDSSINSRDCNYLWNSNYTNGKDICILIEKTSELNPDRKPISVYTRGMAKVMMAELIAFNTNLWNDIPYSEAFSGDNAILNPKLDSQQSIYDEIDQLLVDAINDLSSESSVIDIPVDLIYGGDKEMWLATAYALRARYALILSKVEPNAYTNAITFANQALSAGFIGYVFKEFNTDANGMNPLAQFMYQRSGDLVMASTFIDMLVTDSDPRLSEFSTGSLGSIPGSYDPGSLPGNYAAAPNAYIYHMNLAELYFILAESYLHTDQSDLAFDAFNNGVAASISDVGVVGLPLNLPVDALSLTLEDIIYQKYIANYNTIQGFNDWRRTGFPLLTIPTNCITNEIPRRYTYPEDEVLYNKNVSNDGISLTNRVWWDSL